MSSKKPYVVVIGGANKGICFRPATGLVARDSTQGSHPWKGADA